MNVYFDQLHNIPNSDKVWHQKGDIQPGQHIAGAVFQRSICWMFHVT